MSTTPQLSGRRVLITGGAGGVGRAVAERMLLEGAHVMIVDRPGSEVRAISDSLSQSIDEAKVGWAECDLSESAGVQDMFVALDQQFGGLEMLIACAGVGSGPLMEMSEPEWRFVIESNLMSYVASTQGAIERIRASGAPDGLIVLVGSISVHIKAVGESVYNAAKGGVASFAETLRKELMHEGIRLTLIEPGAIGSAMQPFPEDERARQIEEHKMLSPSHVADAIMFAATRPLGVDVVTLRIEPQVQKVS
jgi:NAD(P)-dependent dehydrogenase (short-subunit alcohol dehydrogenase family)